MDAAVALARQSARRACPNPMVGAVLVRDGAIVAQGFHRACGQAHAEVECLRDAARRGVNPADCTLVVTLEPCRHHGRTPPCTEAILTAGIRHVVIGLLDPSPEAGGGVEVLRSRGVRVESGVRERACRDLAADFLAWRLERRPYVILKLAATLDGRIATRAGHSQWISSEASRAAVQELRACAGAAGGAVLIGGNTFYADNPRLTARCEGAGSRQPLACVVTSRLPAPDADFHLLRERAGESVFFCPQDVAVSSRAEALRALGVRVHALSALPALEGGAPNLDLREALRLLYTDYACRYVLCEGGGRLGLFLLERGLADEFHLHLAPRILGDEAAAPLFAGRAPLRMDETLDLRLCETALCGGDIHLILRPKR